MKRQLLLFFAMMLSAVASLGETVKIDGIWYSLFYNQHSEIYEAHVTNGNKGISDAIGDIVIPETVEYEGISYRVTEISSRAFYDSEVTSVVIPNSVTGIREYAFQNCTLLTSVTGGKNILIIGQEAFSGCSSLTTADILYSVKQIDLAAFGGCRSLTSVTIGKDIYRIGADAFCNCSSLTTVVIGRGLNFIDFYAFAYCYSLKDFYCSATSVPTTHDEAFYGTAVENATLHVPAALIDTYKTVAPWNGFKAVVALKGEIPEIPTCATPTISYANGKLSFDCETEDVNFVSEITDGGDIRKYYDAEIQLKATYHIRVYATKWAYDDSDVATATLCWIDADPKTEGIINSIASVPAKAVLIQTNGGVVTIQGADDGTQVSVYGINGTQAGSAISNNGQAMVNTNLQPGSIAIVKIGEKSVKVIISQK